MECTEIEFTAMMDLAGEKGNVRRERIKDVAENEDESADMWEGVD